jgi:Fe-S-cluster-containing dehydrogenase component
VSEASSGFWNDIIPRVDAGRCKRCADCPPVASCLSNSIRRDEPDSVPVVDDRVCFGCYSCAGACPYEAIVLPRVR